MTNNELIKLYNGLNNIQNVRLPIKITYKLVRNLQKIEPLYQAIDQCRTSIIRRYADIDGDRYEVKLENQEAFFKEMSDLLDSESEDVGLELIKLSDLPDIGLSMAVLESLMPILSGEE